MTKLSFSVRAVALACMAAPALGATYSRSASIVGLDFLDAFTFEAEADPTNGRVSVSQRPTVFGSDDHL